MTRPSRRLCAGVAGSIVVPSDGIAGVPAAHFAGRPKTAVIVRGDCLWASSGLKVSRSSTLKEATFRIKVCWETVRGFLFAISLGI
jgi:hypothetical protein